MLDELEDFLRQAAARRGGQPQQRPQPQRQPEIEYVEPELIEAEPVPESHGSSIRSRHLDTSDVTENSQQLGQRERQADDMMDAHLHEKFDHKMGQIAGNTAEVATHYDEPDVEDHYAIEDTTPYIDDEIEVNVAAAIAKMFQTPSDVRKAIILNEVLARPEDRW